MADSSSTPEIPIFPPAHFVARLNASEARRGKPALTITHPLAMMAWHLATEDLRRPGPLLLITGV